MDRKHTAVVKIEDLGDQGKRRKKIKLEEPSRETSERGKRGHGGYSGGNLSGSGEHPLLNKLVMEVLFKKFLLLNHDDSTEKPLAHLAALRPVCKIWNHQIGEMIRKETRINVNRLINRYPEGLSWEATTSTTAGFKYGAPMSEAIGTFQNLKVTINTCEDLTNTSLLKWFQVMGSTVESLHLTCPLDCYHQNRFVEKMLKEWCPNLQSFTLRGVKCFDVLIQNSFFAKPSVGNECKSLKEFIFFFDGLKCGLESSECEWSEGCGEKIKEFEASRARVLKVKTRKDIYEKRSAFVEDLVDYVDLAVEPTTGIPLAPRLKKLVRRPIGLTSKDGMTPTTFGSHVPDFFQEKFSCEPRFQNDGGIIAQLMKMSKVEKLVIHDANRNKFYDELFAMYFYRQNLWRSSLQHFECLGRSPPETAHKLFSRVGFPLKKLKLEVRRLQLSVYRILSKYAETLEEFELTADGRKLKLPGLPNLKKMSLKNTSIRVVKVTGKTILNKFPKLERFVGTTVERAGSATNFFRGGDGLWRDAGRSQSHPLKELKLLDDSVDKRDFERMVRGFPNLRSVDLVIVPDSVESFKAFWEEMGKLPGLEQVKVSFTVKLKSKWDKPSDLYEKAIADNIGKFKALHWLALNQKQISKRFLLTSNLAKQFAKVTKLRFLKLTRFYVDESEAEEIKKDLANIVFQLPEVRKAKK